MTAIVLRFLYLAIIALWVLAFSQAAVAAITIFDGPLWNGAFQHFNALRRIEAGQAGGIDFQFFHGLLVPYLHFPFYRLLGGGLFASEVVRFALNLVAFVVPFFLVFYYFYCFLTLTCRNYFADNLFRFVALDGRRLSWTTGSTSACVR